MLSLLFKSPVFKLHCSLALTSVLILSDNVHVYTDKKKALDAVVRMEGARFKVFSCREDAEKFAQATSDDTSPLKSPGSKSKGTSGNVTHSGMFQMPILL